MPFATSRGARIHYSVHGASGTPVVLLQGLGLSARFWFDIPDMLAADRARPRRVIAIDNRGTGLSDKPRSLWTMGTMADDVAAVLDHAEIDAAFVVGISMGGMIAQELALAHPERLRSLTLGCTYCGGPGSQLMPEENARKLMEGLASGDREKAIRASYEVNLSPAFRAEESRFAAFHEMATSVPAAKQTIDLQVQAIFGHDTSGRLGEISAPTLIVHGTEDGVLPCPNGELIASLMPSARLEALDGVGHMFWWEQPEVSADLIREHALTAGRA